jgi:hypothetical protein
MVPDTTPHLDHKKQVSTKMFGKNLAFLLLIKAALLKLVK